MVNALLMVAWTSAWMVSSAVGGSLIEKFGYTFTMNITVFLYVVSSFTFYIFFRKTEVKGDGETDWTIVRENGS